MRSILNGSSPQVECLLHVNQLGLLKIQEILSNHWVSIIIVLLDCNETFFNFRLSNLIKMVYYTTLMNASTTCKNSDLSSPFVLPEWACCTLSLQFIGLSHHMGQRIYVVGSSLQLFVTFLRLFLSKAEASGRGRHRE